MWKSIAALLAAALLVPAHAATFESRTFRQLAAEADTIVVGTAAAATARRTAPREIVTDYRFDNLRSVKGNAAGSLTLTLLGGTVGEDSLTVAGAPSFKAGQRYIVFVAGNGSVMFPLVGGPQGIYQVQKDLAGTPRVLDYGGRAVTRLPGATEPAYTDRPAGETADPITEDQFIAAIEAELTRAR